MFLAVVSSNENGEEIFCTIKSSATKRINKFYFERGMK